MRDALHAYRESNRICICGVILVKIILNMDPSLCYKGYREIFSACAALMKLRAWSQTVLSKSSECDLCSPPVKLESNPRALKKILGHDEFRISYDISYDMESAKMIGAMSAAQHRSAENKRLF